MTNEPSGYEAALQEFARGKRLARLARFVRARPGDRCDACGSTLPRLLFGLKDAQTERCYFVGQNCLRWLIEAGLVARARFRHNSETAYEREMKLRRNGDSAPVIDADEIVVPASGAIPPSAGESASSAMGLVKGRWVRQDGVLIFEQPERERALILIALPRLSRPSNGTAGYDG